MSLSPDQITIAVTVFNRRDYVLQAIESALTQTSAVNVIVVKDCGPDQGLKQFVQDRFGPGIHYHRNPQRRGLFDNWNACVELCKTPWLSILHDDDFLSPRFIAAMLDLAEKAPGRGFYFGQVTVIDPLGNRLPAQGFAAARSWREVDLVSFANGNPTLFPGQLFRIDHAKAVGGFRPTSLFAGD